MLLVAATTDSPTDPGIAYTHLSVPVSGPALVLDGPTLRRQLWHGPEPGRPKQAVLGLVHVPLWACHIDKSTGEALFFVTAQWRPDAVVLAAFHRTTTSADASGDVTAWASAIADERGAVNFPLPRPGHRSGQGPEAEEKITLTVPANPAAVARLLRDLLPATGVPVFGATIHRRVLRSDIYLPPGTGRREYAALTPRPDGTWWAKAKVLKAGRLHKSIRPAATRDEALAQVAEALGHPRLVHTGTLHRATWDLPSPADADGHWSTVTVDTTTLAPHPGTLQQVEIEYGACFTATPVTATAARIRHSVTETADTVAAALTAHHIPHVRNGQSKIEHFLAAGDADARH
ncbi:hypothetical protein ACIOC2_14595 [Streptomyces sp. NPDC088337]|uniref:hypothetical protein n=1 Tax=unclassified Streptomyces TaxID=2593676 RepID=UPI002DDA0B91|nr:hypothetical protein [Streptomyces sp. NBC_01788]WSB25554.1 hypothetical protein OIE49_06510 [Streptomyces sp. NBC_01788]